MATVEVVEYVLLTEMLARSGWTAYKVGDTNVVRSPDGRIIVNADLCTPAQIAETVRLWQPPLTDQTPAP
jgi:hypothetical protein